MTENLSNEGLRCVFLHIFINVCVYFQTQVPVDKVRGKWGHTEKTWRFHKSPNHLTLWNTSHFNTRISLATICWISATVFPKFSAHWQQWIFYATQCGGKVLLYFTIKITSCISAYTLVIMTLYSPNISFSSSCYTEIALMCSWIESTRPLKQCCSIRHRTVVLWIKRLNKAVCSLKSWHSMW